MSKKKPGANLSRRGFLKGISAAVGGVAAGVPSFPAVASSPAVLGPGPVEMTLVVNGAARNLKIEPRVTLLSALRNHLDITGPKEACDRGACGACNVRVEGKLVNSCMMLALDAAGQRITTAEGLAKAGDLHPIQKAFCGHDALQCGFCTPGMVVACKALLDGNPDPSLPEIREGLSGNICRCGTYPRIFEAVQAAAQELQK